VMMKAQNLRLIFVLSVIHETMGSATEANTNPMTKGNSQISAYLKNA